MRQLLVFAAVVAVVAAGGSGDVDEALLARVAQILGSSGGSGGGGGFSGGTFLSSGYSAPSGPSQQYGAPSGGGAIAVGRSAGFGGGAGGLQIGNPLRAQRVAEFDLSSGGGGGGFGRSALSNQYGAPTGPSGGAIAIGRSAGGFGGGLGGVQLGRPERAQQLAQFELSGGGLGGNGGSFRSSGGYQ